MPKVSSENNCMTNIRLMTTEKGNYIERFKKTD